MRSIIWQRKYVLFGIEIDRDVDATDIAIHFWPISIEFEVGKQIHF